MKKGLLSPTVWLVLCLLSWGIVALIELNPSIVFIHGIILLIGLSICMAIDKSKINLRLFSIAIFIRSIIAIIAWYSAWKPELAFNTGTNEDSSRFFEASFFSFSDAMLTFEEPGFPALNYFVTNLAIFLGKASYLANIQVVLLFGSLFPVVVFRTIGMLSFKNVAYLTSFIIVLHPITIAFSTGLIRDIIIGTVGWTLIASSLSIFQPRANIFSCVVILVLAGLGLWSLRVTSLVFFCLFSVVFVLFNKGVSFTRYSKLVKYSIVGIILCLVVFGAVTRFDRYENVFYYATMVRSGDGVKDGMDLDPNGITTRVASISPFALIILSPTTIMQPVPFYSWTPPPWIGGPPAFLDIIIGFGGLFNQLLFGFYLIAMLAWIKNRNYLGLMTGGIIMILFSTLALIGLGQIRMTMAHIYPIYFFAIVYAYINGRAFYKKIPLNLISLWIAFILCLYLSYYAYKLTDSITVLLFLAVFPISILTILVRLGSRLASHINKQNKLT